MRLRPRHYVLIGIVLLLGLWNLRRSTHARQSSSPAVPSSPGWQAFDRAAALRDAPDAQFTPALDALRGLTEASAGTDAADLRGCQMWLLYYRHSVPMASGKATDMAMLAANHVGSCSATHRDIGR